MNEIFGLLVIIAMVAVAIIPRAIYLEMQSAKRVKQLESELLQHVN